LLKKGISVYFLTRTAILNAIQGLAMLHTATLLMMSQQGVDSAPLLLLVL